MKQNKNQQSSDDRHSDSGLAQKLAYGLSGLEATDIKKEKESSDYGAFGFRLNNRLCKFRMGKITPKAKNAQGWQTHFFLKISEDKPIASAKL